MSRFHLQFAATYVAGLFAAVAVARQLPVAPPELLTASAMPDQPLEPKPYVSRSEPVDVDFGLLAVAAPGSQMELNLFDDASFIGTVTRVIRRSERSYTIRGAVDGVPHGTFTLVVENEVAVGLIDAAALGQRFKLRYSSAGKHWITQIEDAQFPECGVAAGTGGGAGPPAPVPDPMPEAPPPSGEGGIAGACTEPTAVFDILIAYTDDARQDAGGADAINAECELAIDGMNQGYDNSDVNAVGRLVRRREVSYNESGTFYDHLDRLTDGNDGVLDYLHDERDDYTADMVSLWVKDDDGGTICGLANCDHDAPNAYQVTNWDCAVSNFSFQHECGHLQGCAHNKADDNGCNYYSYSFGWRWFGDSGSGWRTVMAYNNDAGDYTRINYFSNPDIAYDGKATGKTDEAENERTLDNRRRAVEEFRDSKFDVWVDFAWGGSENGTFDNPYDTVIEGVNGCFGGGGARLKPTLHIKAGTTSETLTISKPMFITSCGGVARIGD